MTSLYVAVYRVPLKRRRPQQLNPTAASFYDSVLSDSFPYDGGDDPSFFASAYHNGPVSWGVCRPDVRCNIKIDDWVAFFSAESVQPDPTTTHYRFVGTLRVEKKLSHIDLFSPRVLFSSYLNLLIRPRDAGWEHFEPGLDVKDWHDDWLWRIICAGRKWRKEDLITTGRHHVQGAPLLLHGQLLPIADNYVVFSKDEIFISPLWPVVAVHRRGEGRET